MSDTMIIDYDRSEELKKLNEHGFAFIKICLDSEKEELKFTQKGVTYYGNPVGDWQIKVKKIK